MTKAANTICIFIQSDPRTSHRPCEALRLALGLASSGHPLTLILAKAAPMLLTGEGETAVDGERAIKYLEGLKAFRPAVYIDTESLGGQGGKPAFELSPHAKNAVEIIPLTKEALAQELGRPASFFSF